MEIKMYKMLQNDLKKAIDENDYETINKIKEILDLSDQQKKYFEQGLTGFPSIDEVWYKYYPQGSKNIALSFPRNKTVWDEIEKKLNEYSEYDAISFFKNNISRPEFIENVYRWARFFKAINVEEDEVVPIYGPFTPDICAITFALNMIGASSYFLKLAIDSKSLGEETKNSKIAIVFDSMWPIVKNEFEKDKFKKIFVYSIYQNMPSPKKEIVSFLSKIQSKKLKSSIPVSDKYIWLDKAMDITNYYSCNDSYLKTEFKPNRTSFITSSSGTTGGLVKGVVATNESVLAQIYQSNAVDVQYHPGDRILNHFPPTASTSLNSLFLIPLYHGSTVMIDPRVTPEDFYNQLTKLKPTLCVNTGSAWELFFNRIEKEMSKGKKFDFGFSKGWVIGGEGTDVKKFLKWQEIMGKCNAPKSLCSAYGQSELFSAITSEQMEARGSLDKQIMSVGIPYSGISLGVFDERGNELTYNQRGEIIIKGYTVMKEYYNKPELTNSVKKDGRIYTGDIGEIDENGFLYVWGRKKDKIILQNGQISYLFDIANAIKENEFIYDSMCFKKNNELVSHIVWNDDYTIDEKIQKIKLINEQMEARGVQISCYKEHENLLPYSQTTLKKDRNLMNSQNEGFIQVIDDELCIINFELNSDNEYEKVVEKKIVEKVKTKVKKK